VLTLTAVVLVWRSRLLLKYACLSVFIFLCARLSALKLLVPSKVLNSFEICVLVVDDGCRGISRSVGAPLRQVKVPVGSRTCEMVGRSGV